MTYTFLIDTYETERLKTLSMWSMFRDGDMEFRPHPTDSRGRSVREQMVHQCVSENLWFLIYSVSTWAHRHFPHGKRVWRFSQDTLRIPVSGSRS